MKILIVEHDALVRALLDIELRAMVDAETSWATNGREALALLKKNPTDLIISSWSLSDMDGGLLKACKQDPGLKRIPFVMTSTLPEHGVQAMEAGADIYLAKPFTPEELQEVLGKVRPLDW